MKPISFSGRVAASSAGDQVSEMKSKLISFLREPFPTIHLGAARAAKQPYLLWSTQEMLKIGMCGNTEHLTYTGRTITLGSNTWIDSNDVVDQNTGYELLYRLFIEPFALMCIAEDP